MAPKPPTLDTIHIDGTTLEGGGQLVRLALSLASLTRKPITITNIRGKRSGGGGLRAQHLTCVQWLAQACTARLSGVGLKSKEITFSPGPSSDLPPTTPSTTLRISQSTPGSTSLILQAILPYLLFSNSLSVSGLPLVITISGGTNVSASPSHDYINHVLLPMLSLIGIPHITAELHSRGWSQGATRLGSVTYTITPLCSGLPAFQLTDRGRIVHVAAHIIAPAYSERDFRDELERMFDSQSSRLFPALIPSPLRTKQTSIFFEPSHHDKRYYILLVAHSSTGIRLGRDWLYDIAIRQGRTERIVRDMVKRVGEELVREIEGGACVDEWMRDQIVVFQGLAGGKCVVKEGVGKVGRSMHARTAMWVAERILGVEFDDSGSCVGIGFGRIGEVEDKEAEWAG